MNLLEQILVANDYELVNDPGLITGVRPDGTRLSMLRWSNTKHAEAVLIPRNYVVVCGIGGRWRLPTVEWERFLPVEEQTPRKTADIIAEFNEVFAPMLELPTDEGATILRGAGERYDMGAILDRSARAAGLCTTSFMGRKKPVHAPSGAEYRVYGEGRRLVASRHKSDVESSMALVGRDWDDVTEWLREAVV
ncbi:hypothetical protein [Pseudoclavibacter sp. VKM Ac-2888]|uniref:hypothetical protein n=1 Tax=Pseudoclavibacter sp. VKM Ac-2888 TaxID=2783830 RepID=UPI00188A6739|nr:hypothetical protein [Pseudoclavibacter sp. VKM Ac-2888]MBF4549354.1 hypothetical protein [Pseudoclavibacter sp. VKM Ac-2888]